MERIAISKFKATCFAVLENVRQSGQPVLVTRFGKPVAEIVPPRSQKLPRRQLGSMAGTGRIIGDIISPAADKADWEALK